MYSHNVVKDGTFLLPEYRCLPHWQRWETTSKVLLYKLQLYCSGTTTELNIGTTILFLSTLTENHFLTIFRVIIPVMRLSAFGKMEKPQFLTFFTS